MADLFISYAKADWQQVLRLSAFLESKGWSVWWDKGLAPGERYRDEIAMQLGAARIVLVLWTPNSIGSDWVRAEAGAARQAGKLLPLKSREVGYGDIPLPFGELHTEPVENEDLIALAIAAHLQAARPERGMVAAGLSQIKLQALTWLGIIGGALTLFTNLSSLVKLADWAAWLVGHWREITQSLWRWLLPWLGLKVPKEWASTLTFAVFFVSLVAGVILLDWKRAGLRPQFRLGLRMSAIYLVLVTGLGAVALSVAVLWRTPSVVWASATILALAALLTPLIAIALAGGPALLRIVNFLIYYVFFFILAVGPGSQFGAAILAMENTVANHVLLMASVRAVNVLPLLAVFAAEPASLLKRFSFIGLGLIGLFLLNKVAAASAAG